MTAEVFNRVLAFSKRVGFGWVEDARSAPFGVLIVTVDIHHMHTHCVGDLIRAGQSKRGMVGPLG